MLESGVEHRILVWHGDHKPGISGTLRCFAEHGKLKRIMRKFSEISGENCNKQNIFYSSFRYLCKTAVERQGYYFRLHINTNGLVPF